MGYGGMIGMLVMVISACAAGSEDTRARDPLTAVPVVPTEDALSTLIAMQKTATETPTETPLPTSTMTPTPTLTPSAVPTAVPPGAQLPSAGAPGLAQNPTQAPSASPLSLPTNTPRSTQVMLATLETTPVPGTDFDRTGEIHDHYWLERPFPRDPTNTVADFASRSYPYGTTGGGGFQVHHGIDIQNLLGTPILAVANGTVFYAGDDSEVMFGPSLNFYGNLVVIAHDRPAPDGRPLYTLYGHMNRVSVSTGQRVQVRDTLGQVGATGVALGSHLHLEVRIGDPYDYGSTYNPDLWIKPWRGYGTLAGRVFDRDGSRLYDLMITIQPVNGPGRTTYSYSESGPNSDPYYGEHFTYADLPAGDYQVIVRIRGMLRFKDTVTVSEGQTSWVVIRLS